MTDSEEQAAGLPAFVKDPIGMIRRRWPWMVAFAGAGLVSTVIYVLSLPVTYLARATILVTSQQIPESFVTTTVTQDPFERINALVGEILSRERLTGMVEKHDPYPELADQSSMVELVGLMRSSVSVGSQAGVGRRSRTQPSTIYAISFRHSDPNMAALVANDLASLFTAASSRSRGEQARRTTQFMRAQLEDTERDLRENQRIISDYKGQYRGELPSELSANLAKLERLAGQRQALQLQISQADARVSDLAGSIDTTSSNSPYARLAALNAKLATETAINTDEHPNVIALRRQIESLNEEIRSGGSGPAPFTQDLAVDAARRSSSDLRRMLANGEAETAELEQKVARTPIREEELMGMEGQLGVLRENYVSQLRKVEAAELAETLESAEQGERVQVLDRALPPSAPENTRMKYLFAGIGASLAGALGIAALFELLDPVLVSRSQIEETFGVPVLGSVSKIG
jgi:succinoglycan biosynthesis transport protein ExoP